MNRLTRAPSALSSRDHRGRARRARRARSQPWSDVCCSGASGTSVTWSGAPRAISATNSGVGLPSMLYSIRGPNSSRDQRRQLAHVGAPDVALVGARVDRDAVRAGRDHQARRLEHARIADVALVAQQRHLVEVDAELGLDRLQPSELPLPSARKLGNKWLGEKSHFGLSDRAIYDRSALPKRASSPLAPGARDRAPRRRAAASPDLLRDPPGDPERRAAAGRAAAGDARAGARARGLAQHRDGGVRAAPRRGLRRRPGRRGLVRVPPPARRGARRARAAPAALGAPARAGPGPRAAARS